MPLQSLEKKNVAKDYQTKSLSNIGRKEGVLAMVNKVIGSQTAQS
jgi:hypothetical protein